VEQLGADRAALAAVRKALHKFFREPCEKFYLGTPEAAYVAPRKASARPEAFEAESSIHQAFADTTIASSSGMPRSLCCRPANMVNFSSTRRWISRQEAPGSRKISADGHAQRFSKADRQRDKYIRTRTKLSWEDATNYHLA